MKSLAPRHLISLVGAVALLASANSCAFSNHQSIGRISVQVVSWPLVKKLAESDAGLPGHKVTILKSADHGLVAEKLTDTYGTVVFDVPAGTYTVLGMGFSNEPETVTVEPGQVVKLKLIVH
jgi:hypothetical protein